MLKDIIETLHRERCSLVVEKDGRQYRFFKKGVRDLEDLLNHSPELLEEATAADKVIGKAAAGMVVVGKVKQLYADVLSRKALKLLDAAGISYSCGQLVDHIVIAENDDRCPLEKIVAPATTAEEVVAMLRAHFAKMQKLRQA
jgi:hypothetical protein